MIDFRSGILGLTLTSALVLAASSASAADIYKREAAVGGYKDGPVYVSNTWTGFYIGANVGYGWSVDGSATEDFLTIPGGFATRTPFAGPDQSGVFGGGQIGYNYQISRLVVGVEADLQASDFSDSYVTAPIGGVAGKVDANLDYFGTVRGRIGYAFDRTLVYATGGFAYGNVDTKLVFPTVSYKKDETLTGYTIGGGVEHKFAPNWSIKAEYQYVDLGSYVLNDKTFNQYRTTDFDVNFHTVRVGINYHFNQEYEPLK